MEAYIGNGPRGADAADSTVTSKLGGTPGPGHNAWLMVSSALVLFMTLPGPAFALDAWDSMYATAQRMSEVLNAELLDEEKNRFTRQKEAQIREDMRAYDRSQG